jgi:uncharacterized protein YbjT (DUF2867 family)
MPPTDPPRPPTAPPAAVPTPPRLRVLVAGATGFVGQALLRALGPEVERIGVARRAPTGAAADGVQWRAADLFNLKEAERALEGVDVAVYLIHSMLPQARLTQARFDDLDLICADNFARACAAQGVRRVVYLGGLLPRGAAPLSRHLASRLEVEGALAAHGAAVTTLRAGLIIGAGGSSFEMMSRLVRRLPVMVAPRWSATRSQPIALDDVLPLLRLAIAEPGLAGQAYDIGGPDVVSYADMLRATGRALGRRVRVLTLPVRTANLSLLWVSAITGASQALVRPLVESLDHDMIVTDGGALQRRAGHAPRPLSAAIAEAFADEARRPAAPARPAGPPPRAVCSVQRLPLPAGRDAAFVAAEYLRWLPQALGPLLRVSVQPDPEGERCRFGLAGLRAPLLELQRAPGRSAPDRQLFYVTGGLLAAPPPPEGGPKPRLEFRLALGGQVALAAVQDFVPRLPWALYRLSQGPVHLLVMRAFGRHLGRLAGAVGV